MKSADIQEGLYTKRELSAKFTLLWRVLKDLGELEVVLRVKGNSYAAIGWRPKDVNLSCLALPNIEGFGEIVVENIRKDEDTTEDHLHDNNNEEIVFEDSNPQTEENNANDENETAFEEEIDLEEASDPTAKSRVEKSIGISIGYVKSSVSIGMQFLNFIFFYYYLFFN